MKRISLDNGCTYIDAAEALNEWPLDDLALYMDDETREAVAFEMAPCTDVEFLTRYLELAPEDLVIG